jgi:hypothetical protein
MLENFYNFFLFCVEISVKSLIAIFFIIIILFIIKMVMLMAVKITIYLENKKLTKK